MLRTPSTQPTALPVLVASLEAALLGPMHGAADVLGGICLDSYTPHDILRG